MPQFSQRRDHMKQNSDFEYIEIRDIVSLHRLTHQKYIDILLQYFYF